MSNTPGPARSEGDTGDVLEELWLLGQPTLSRLLEFVRDSVIDGERMDCRALAAEWRAANEYCRQLERTEAGIALDGRHRALDPALADLAEALQAHPHFRKAFDALPTELRMVELDKLIVDQMHVTLGHVDTLAARLGPAPDERALFGLCLPLDEPLAPVAVQQVGEHRWVFRCPSTDFRFHEATLLRPAQLSGYESFGAIAGVVGLVVGFGCNFLCAVRVGRRHLLVNGYHRAVALRRLGITHAPCIVQEATCVDELQIAAKSRVAERAEFYFESARPPLLKDFFDPRLSKRLPLRPRIRHIELSFEVRDHLLSE
jgi:hypothetical protein